MATAETGVLDGVIDSVRTPYPMVLMLVAHVQFVRNLGSGRGKRDYCTEVEMVVGDM